jgi:hypothetical protein
MEEERRARPWPFSAPESYLLLHGPSASGRQALKLALTELVAGGQARLDRREARTLGFRRSVPTLALGRAPIRPLRAPVRTVLLELERAAAGRGPVDVSKLVERVRATYGSLDGYRDRAVLPSLVEAGLCTEARHRLLWIIPVVRRSLTPQGEAARLELAELQRRGPDELRGRSDDQPGTALAYAGAAGAAVLLMPELFPELRELERIRRQGGADTAVYAETGAPGDDGPNGTGPIPDGPGPTAPSPTPVATPTALSVQEPPTPELWFDFGGLDGIGGLDAAMDAIDAGIGDGGGADGDGGGGGDGGGD